MRKITSCSRCRRLKIRCDRAKPACKRCTHAGADCSLNVGNTDLTLVPSSLSTSPSVDSTSPNPTLAIDDSGSNDVAPKSRKRHRAPISCVRCRRLKVRCDKQHPCGRCRLSGWAKSCTYTHPTAQEQLENNDDAEGFVDTSEDPGSLINIWHERHRGLSHWQPLLSRFGSFADVESAPFLMATDISKNDNNCQLENALPSNFPFNSPDAVKYMPLSQVRDLVQKHKDEHQAFITQYMELYHPIHPILIADQFADQVDLFWEDSSAMNVSWLAMFLMVLGLGSVSEEMGSTYPSTDFFMAAEACLSKTPFMFRPTITSLRTLCLMVIAKQVSNSTCWGVDSSWSFMGIVLRLGVLAGLHRRHLPSEIPTQTVEELQSARNLWMTIIYFSIQTSMVTGMPNLLSVNEIMPLNNTTFWTPAEMGVVSPWYQILHSSTRPILDIVSRINSDVKLTYEEVVDCNTEVRQLMGMLDRAEIHESQRIALGIFFRRVLVTLHRPYALDLDAPYLYPSSYWASLECSLAILVHYRELYDSHRKPRSLSLVARLFLLDFFSATVSVSVHLLREDAPLDQGYVIPPRQTILATLEACADIWAGERHRSVCFQTAYRFLVTVTGMIKGEPEKMA